MDRRYKLIAELVAVIFAIAFAVAVRYAYTAGATCSITGQVFNIDQTPCANCTISFNSAFPQPVTTGGTSYTSQPVSTTTDANGNLTPIALPQGLVTVVTISEKGATFGGFTAVVPLLSTVTFVQFQQGVSFATPSPTATPTGGTPSPTPTVLPPQVLHGAQFFNANGTFVVPLNVQGLTVECWGGGGGGGGYGTTSSGSCPNATCTDGGTGGTATVKLASTTVCSAAGGTGGHSANAGATRSGGLGGSGITGTLILHGWHGFGPVNLQAEGNGGGEGGTSPRGGSPASTDQTGAGGPGGGAGGGTFGGGGGGGAGYASSVLQVTSGQTYAVVVGVAGTAGAGTTQAGFAGNVGGVYFTW